MSAVLDNVAENKFSWYAYDLFTRPFASRKVAHEQYGIRSFRKQEMHI